MELWRRRVRECVDEVLIIWLFAFSYCLNKIYWKLFTLSFFCLIVS